MTELRHLTIDTRDLRTSRRRDVDDAVVTIVAQDLAYALVEGEVQIRPGYVLRPTVVEETLLATVLAGDLPLVTIGVTPDDRQGGELWRQIERPFGPLPSRPDAPLCVVKLHPALGDDPAATWLGDYERCLAWAWLERGNRS